MIIIIPDHIGRIELQYPAPRIYFIVGSNCGAVWIQPPCDLYQLTQYLFARRIILTPLLHYFVANTPHEYRSMIPVAAELVFEVFGMPFIPVEMVIVFVFF